MSSRKKVLVKISFQADVESTCNVAAPPKSGFSPAVPLDPLGITAKPKIDRDPFVNFEFAYPDDCTWNPRLHVSVQISYLSFWKVELRINLSKVVGMSTLGYSHWWKTFHLSALSKEISSKTRS